MGKMKDEHIISLMDKLKGTNYEKLEDIARAIITFNDMNNIKVGYLKMIDIAKRKIFASAFELSCRKCKEGSIYEVLYDEESNIGFYNCTKCNSLFRKKYQTFKYNEETLRLLKNG